MKNPLTALALSAFVFPGAGQLYLRQRLIGGLLVGIALVCLVVLVMQSMAVAQGLVVQLERGEVALTLGAIMDAMHSPAYQSPVE